MKAGWQIRQLSDFVMSRPGNNKIIKGKQSAQPGDGLFQGYSASGPDVWVVIAEYNQPGVVISAVGARCGKTFIADGDWTAIANTHVLLPGKEIDSRWLWYRTNDEKFWIKGGSAQPFVKVKDTLQQPIPIPPLVEQQRIVGILDEAFDGIATAKANAEQNLQNARALFESHLQSVFTRRGEGLVDATLGEVCEFIGGSQPPKSVFEKTKTDDNIRLIQIRDYKSDRHIVYIPRAQARRFCNSDDVMIGRYGPPIFQILRGIEGAYNVALMKAVPDESKLARDYLFYFLKHSAILEYVIYHSERAAGQIGLTKETLAPYPIALPSLAQQQKVVSIISELESETQRLESLYQRKLAAFDELKKSLLHQAFAGQL